MLYSEKFVLTFEDVCEALGSKDKPFPKSTLHALNKSKKGPNWFKRGRRLYVLRTDFEAWLISGSQKDQL